MTPRAPTPRVQDLVPEDLLDLWEERAGIMQYDGGLSRDEAESLILDGFFPKISRHPHNEPLPRQCECAPKGGFSGMPWK